MKSIFLTLRFFIFYFSPMQLSAQARLTLDFTKQGPAVSPMLYGSMTGTFYLKVVNTSGKMQIVNIDFKGKIKVMQHGLSVNLNSDDPMITNSITEPEKIVPVTETLEKIKKNFNYT